MYLGYPIPRVWALSVHINIQRQAHNGINSSTLQKRYREEIESIANMYILDWESYRLTNIVKILTVFDLVKDYIHMDVQAPPDHIYRQN